QLPNGQIMQSLWQEKFKAPSQVCISRNVKFIYNGQEQVREVQYFTRLVMNSTEVEDAKEAQFTDVTVIHLYTLPDEQLLQVLSNTLVVSKFSNQLVVMHGKSIMSLVRIVPHCLRHPSSTTEDYFFLMEKPGLDISQLGIPYNSVYQDEADQDVNIE
ncbi:hypothetical protein EDD16DRAFT_1499669, partial [Pisolithus croceorrhizus]